LANPLSTIDTKLDGLPLPFPLPAIYFTFFLTAAQYFPSFLFNLQFDDHLPPEKPLVNELQFSVALSFSVALL